MDAKDLAENLRSSLACYGVATATVSNTLGRDVVTLRNHTETVVVAVTIEPKCFSVLFVYAKPMPTEEKTTLNDVPDLVRFLRRYFQGQKDMPRGLLIKAEHALAIKAGKRKITLNKIPVGTKEGDLLYTRESWQWVDGVREAKHRKVEDRLGPVLPWIGNLGGDPVEWRVIYAADGAVNGIRWLSSSRMEPHSSRFLLKLTDIEYVNGAFELSFEPVWRHDGGLGVEAVVEEGCSHKDSVFNQHRMVYFCPNCRQEFDSVKEG